MNDYEPMRTISDEEMREGLEKARTPKPTVEQQLRNACQQAADLYDALSLGTLEAAAKYGPDWEPPTDVQLLEVRSVLAAALAKPEEQADK